MNSSPPTRAVRSLRRAAATSSVAKVTSIPVPGKVSLVIVNGLETIEVDRDQLARPLQSVGRWQRESEPGRAHSD